MGRSPRHGLLACRDAWQANVLESLQTQSEGLRDTGCQEEKRFGLFVVQVFGSGCVLRT